MRDPMVEMKALYLLHQDEWTEDLVGQEFSYVFSRVLTKRERQVTEMKVQGMNNDTICKLLGVRLKTLREYISVIKKKYRIQTDEKYYNDPHLREMMGKFRRKDVKIPKFN